MRTIDLVACVGGGIVLLTYLLLMCYMRNAAHDKVDLIVGAFKHCLNCWTVFCFITAACSVVLYIETSKEPNNASVEALVVFLCSTAFVSPLILLDVELRSCCTISFLGICMLATPCAWLVFFATGPSPSFMSCILFIWSFAHHVLFDSWIWFATYLDNRAVLRIPTKQRHDSTYCDRSAA